MQRLFKPKRWSRCRETNYLNYLWWANKDWKYSKHQLILHGLAQMTANIVECERMSILVLNVSLYYQTKYCAVACFMEFLYSLVAVMFFIFKFFVVSFIYCVFSTVICVSFFTTSSTKASWHNRISNENEFCIYNWIDILSKYVHFCMFMCVCNFYMLILKIDELSYYFFRIKIKCKKYEGKNNVRNHNICHFNARQLFGCQVKWSKM